MKLFRLMECWWNVTLSPPDMKDVNDDPANDANIVRSTYMQREDHMASDPHLLQTCKIQTPTIEQKTLEPSAVGFCRT